MDVQTKLDQAISAARAGRTVEARQLLESVLDVDERNEQAWLWLSSVVESDQERAICLENVLTINPYNEAARKGLAALPPRLEGSAPPPSPSAIPYLPDQPPPGDASSASPSRSDRRVFISITIALVLILICTVLSILAFVILSPMG